MNFLDALKYSYENRTNDEEFADPFFLYCRLSDLCGSGYEDKRRGSLFYQINKKLNLVRAVLRGDESMERKYQEVADIISESNFEKLIETLKSVIDRENKDGDNAEWQTQENTDLQKTASKAEDGKTPCVNSRTGGNCVGAWLSATLGLVFALGAVVLFGCIFRWFWISWQWVIGIGGGLLLFVIASAITAWLNEKLFVDYYVFGAIVLGICILTNFILFLLFKSDYNIIFDCFSLIELFVGIIFSCVLFKECEEEFGCITVIETVVVFILIIVGFVCL